MPDSKTQDLPRRLVADTVAAVVVGASRKALQEGRQGRGLFATLPWYKLGRLARYDLDEIAEWTREHARRVVRVGA